MDEDEPPTTAGSGRSPNPASDSPSKHEPPRSHDNTSPPLHNITEYSTQSHDHHSPISASLHKKGSPSHDTDPAVVTEDTLSKLYQDDAIGDTVFSKAWVLSTLVEIVKTVEEEDRVTALPASQGEEDKDELSSSSPVEKMNCFGEVMGVGGEGGVGGDAGEGVLELDEEVEGRLCTLWDASMNTTVAEFIHKQEGIDLLLGAAHKSHKPRLSEICLGIIGNLLCCREICLTSFKEPEQRSLMFQFFQDTDPGVLCQVTRLTQTFLSHEELQQTWIPEIMESAIIKEVLLFILQGSTNDELLTSTSALLDLLLNSSDQLLVEWVDGQLVDSVCEAIQQTRCSHFEVTCTLIATLHTVTSVQEGVACVLSCAEKVSMVLHEFFGVTDHLENLSDCLTPLTAACSVQLTLLDNHRAVKGSNVLKVLERLRKKIDVSSRTQQLVKLISNVIDLLCTDAE